MTNYGHPLAMKMPPTLIPSVKSQLFAINVPPQERGPESILPTCGLSRSFRVAGGRADSGAAMVSEIVSEASRFKPRRSAAVPGAGFHASARAMTPADTSSRAIHGRRHSSDSEPAPPAEPLPVAGTSVCVGNRPIDSLTERLAGFEVRGVSGGERCRRCGPRVARRSRGSVTEREAARRTGGQTARCGRSGDRSPQ